MEIVYWETSFVSLLVSNPSRDLAVEAERKRVDASALALKDESPRQDNP